MESLSDAAACVIQQTFYALQSRVPKYFWGCKDFGL